MLTMGGFPHTTETMTLYHTLEAFTLGSSNHFHFLSFSKNVTGDDITGGLFYIVIAEFLAESLGGRTGLREMRNEAFRGVFFFAVAKCDLNGLVTVGIPGFHLGNDTRSGFNDRAGSLSPIWFENTGHTDLLTNDTFHVSLFTQRLRVFSLSSGLGGDLKMLRFYLHIHTGGKIQLGKGVDRTGGRSINVQ